MFFLLFRDSLCGKFFCAILDFFKFFFALFSAALVVVVLVESGHAILRLVKQKIIVMRHSDDFFSVHKDNVFAFVNVSADFSDHFFVDAHSALFDKFVRFAPRTYTAFRKIFVDSHKSSRARTASARKLNKVYKKNLK